MNRKSKTGNKPNYVNETVFYTVKRLGEKPSFSSSNKQETGRFTIEGQFITLGDIAFHKNDIQWIGLYKRSHAVRLDVNIDGWWHQISMNPGTDGETFLKELRKRIPVKLNQSKYLRRPEIRTYQSAKAYVTSQNLQGIFEKHEEVELYVTPLWMVVLHEGRVFQQHFIDDIVDIRSTKHPTDPDVVMKLLTFEVEKQAFAYALKSTVFVTRLSDATKEGIDSEMMRKKKKADS